MADQLNSSTCEVCLADCDRGETSYWCRECEQQICPGCKDNHEFFSGLKYHIFIAMKDYKTLPPKMSEISSFCAAHGEYYDLFCKHHLKPCCSKCYVESHTSCKNISPLYDVITELTTTVSIDQMRDQWNLMKEDIKKARSYCLSHLQSPKSGTLQCERSKRDEAETIGCETPLDGGTEILVGESSKGCWTEALGNESPKKDEKEAQGLESPEGGGAEALGVQSSKRSVVETVGAGSSNVGESETVERDTVVGDETRTTRVEPSTKRCFDTIRMKNELRKVECVGYTQPLETLEKLEDDCDKEVKLLNNISEYASEFQVFMCMDDLLTNFANKYKSAQLLFQEQNLRLSPSLKGGRSALKKPALFDNDFSLKKLGLLRTSEYLIYPSLANDSHEFPGSLSQTTTLITGFDYTLGCFITQKHKLVISSLSSIKAFNKRGEFEFELEVDAFDIAQGPGVNTIVTSSGFNIENVFTFIDLNERKVIKSIKSPLRKEIYGIIRVPNTNTYLFATPYNGIKMSDMKFESYIDVISGLVNDDNNTYIALHDNLIFQSSSESHCVICYNFFGDLLWTFRDQKILSSPAGIDIDNSGNVYVVGTDTNNMLVISPDGKHHRQLLSESDGIEKPVALYVDKERSQVLVTNMENNAFLFDIKY